MSNKHTNAHGIGTIFVMIGAVAPETKSPLNIDVKQLAKDFIKYNSFSEERVLRLLKTEVTPCEELKKTLEGSTIDPIVRARAIMNGYNGGHFQQKHNDACIIQSIAQLLYTEKPWFEDEENQERARLIFGNVEFNTEFFTNRLVKRSEFGQYLKTSKKAPKKKK